MVYVSQVGPLDQNKLAIMDQDGHDSHQFLTDGKTGSHPKVCLIIKLSHIWNTK